LWGGLVILEFAFSYVWAIAWQRAPQREVCFGLGLNGEDMNRISFTRDTYSSFWGMGETFRIVNVGLEYQLAASRIPL
jgi:hypothetical protein